MNMAKQGYTWRNCQKKRKKGLAKLFKMIYSRVTGTGLY